MLKVFSRCIKVKKNVKYKDYLVAGKLKGIC